MSVLQNTAYKKIIELINSFSSYVRPRVNQNDYGGMALPPPIILESHLFYVSSNLMTLRGEIDYLIRNRVIRAFNLGLNTYTVRDVS